MVHLYWITLETYTSVSDDSRHIYKPIIFSGFVHWWRTVEGVFICTLREVVICYVFTKM